MSKRLVPEWKRVAKKSWSIRLAAAAGVLGAVDAGLQIIAPVYGRVWLSSLSALVAVAAAVARLVAQKDMHDEQ